MQKRQEKDNEKAILLNIGDIQEFRDNLYEQEKAAETIVNSMIAALNQFLKYA